MRRLKSPQKRLKATWTQNTPIAGVALTIRMRRTISPLKEQAWTAVQSC